MPMRGARNLSECYTCPPGKLCSTPGIAYSFETLTCTGKNNF